MTTTEKRQARAKLINDARAIQAKAEAEKRELLAEEREADDRLWTEAEKLRGEIEAEEGAASRKTRWQEAEATNREPQPRRVAPAQPGTLPQAEGPKPLTITIKRNRVYSRAPITEEFTFAPNSAAWRRNQPEYREAFRAYLRSERGEVSAQLRTDSAVDGGYFTIPEQMTAELIHDLDDIVLMRRLCRTFVTTAQTLGARKRTARLSTFAWGTELEAPTADSSLKFGKRALTPHYMTGEISVSNDLLRAAEMNPEMIVREEMARDSGELEEDAFFTGSGAGRPLGIFTASNDGISTGRDVNVGSTTLPTADGLHDVFYSLKAGYRLDPSCQWLFHRTAIKLVRKLKDGEGQYLWQPGLQAGQPDLLMTKPVNESERAPSTFTSGLYFGMLACFRHYWIVDGLDFGLQTHDLDIRTNLKGFISRRKVDGMPMVEEAFSRIKLSV